MTSVRAAAAARRQRAGLGDDAGMTLPEVLITISIMSIAFVALLAALATLIRTSGDQREQADANAAIASASRP